MGLNIIIIALDNIRHSNIVNFYKRITLPTRTKLDRQIAQERTITQFRNDEITRNRTNETKIKSVYEQFHCTVVHWHNRVSERERE